MKIKYRLVYCPNGTLRGDGRAQVKVEAAQGGRRKYFGSNVYVRRTEWNSRKMEVVGHPNADELNAYLFEMVVNLERMELELWKRGVKPTLALLKEAVATADEPELSFHVFCERNIATSVRCVSTKKNLMSTLKCLSSFTPGYSWTDLDHKFVQHFEAWLHHGGFARNTVIKHLRNLRTLINEAIVSGFIRCEENPFRTFKISGHRTPHRFLSPEDLASLESLAVEGRLAHTKDAFLFCCYTGLRFSDFCSLQDECFSTDRGCVWIRVKMKKTGVEVRVPLSLLFNGKGLLILQRYESVASFVRIGSNSKVNGELKVLQGMARIKTRMTFHLSRHTCATLLCHQGVPVTTVQKILGHTKVSMTQLYQEVMSETIVNDLQRAQQALSR